MAWQMTVRWRPPGRISLAVRSCANNSTERMHEKDSHHGCDPGPALSRCGLAHGIRDRGAHRKSLWPGTADDAAAAPHPEDPARRYHLRRGFEIRTRVDA